MRNLKQLAGAALLAVVVPSAANAQGGADIYVVTFNELGSRVSVGRPVNVTRRAGYDNQPSFSADGSAILYTSVRGDAQADIWRVSVRGGAAQKLTQTPESEYSATTMPGGGAYSVIRVERDSTQRLWRFPFDGSAPSLVLTALRPVGYHVWVGDATLGAFVLGQPNALVVVDARTERVDTVARDIGRALVRFPGRDAFTFLAMGKDTSWISEVDVRTHAVRRVVPALPRADYHLWTPGGRLIAGSGTRLFILVDGRWDILADFAEFGVKGISRLALSPTATHLAFVAEDGGVP